MLLVGAVMVAIVIAVAITIAVVAAVPATLGLRAVQYQRHVLELLLLVELLQVWKHAALHQAGANHEDGAVGQLLDDLGISHDLDWRTVDEHIVVFLTQLADHLAQAVGEEKLRRVWRDGTDWQEVEALHEAVVLALADNLIDALGAAVQVVAQALTWGAHKHGGTAVAQVAIHHDNTLLLDGERHGDVTCQVALATARVEGSEDNDLLLRMGAYHELQVGAQYTERLVHDVTLARLHHNLANLLRLLPELDALLQRWAVFAAHAERYLAQEWDGDVLQVLAATNRRIHVLTNEDYHDWYQQAQYEGYQQDVAANRRHWLDVARRRGDDSGVVGGEGLGEFVLLTFLEEEEVEGLLHLLLATHRLQIFCLVRVAGYLGGGLRLVGLQVGKLGVEAHHEVVDAGDDALAHRRQGLVVVGDERVLLAGVRHEVVALQLGLVVLADLLLDARVLDARVGRQELVLAHLAGEEVADVLRHGDAGGEVENQLVGLAALLHELLCGGLHVRQEVGALEGGDVLIHIAQLTLDDAEALGDEVGGGDGHLVLVVHPVLAINGDDGVQDVLGTGGEHILVSEVDDGRLLLAQVGGEVRLDLVGHGVEVGTGHVELRGLGWAAALLASVQELAVGRGYADLDLADRRAIDMAELHFQLGVIIDLLAFLVDALEIREDGTSALLHLHAQGGTLLVAKVEELDGDWQVLAIEGHLMETAVDGVVHVEVESLAGLQQHRWRLDGNQLVVDVALAAAESHVGKHGGDVAAYALPLAVLLDHEGGGALIHAWGGEEVIHGDAEGHCEGEDKPSPAAQAKVKQVLQANEIVGLRSAAHTRIGIRLGSILNHFFLMYN